jgi:DNA-binding IclR family transcriptional regulator
VRRGPKPDPASIRSRVLAALRVRDGSAADIAQRAGVPAVQTQRALVSFENQERAKCDRTVRPRVWSEAHG